MIKIKLDLPTREKITAGLTSRELHAPLARAEQHASDAEQQLERRRSEFADHERIVAELPDRISRGEIKASALTDALRDRDASALLVAPVELALAAARDRIIVEERIAKSAVEREFVRRVELLEAAAAEVSPALVEINALSQALASAYGAGGILGSVEWPDSPSTMAQMRTLAGSNR